VIRDAFHRQLSRVRRGRRWIENGHVRFPYRFSAGAFRAQPIRALARLGSTLDARPRAPPNRLKWEVPAFLRQAASCRLLLRSFTRASATVERPTLATHRLRAFPPGRPCASPRLPYASLARTVHDSPSCFQREAGKRATQRPSTPFAGPGKLGPTSQAPKTTARRRAACEAALRIPPSVAPRMVEAMDPCRVGRRDAREGPTPHS